MLTMESQPRNRNSISLDLVQSISSLMDIPKDLLWNLLTKIQFRLPWLSMNPCLEEDRPKGSEEGEGMAEVT